MCWPQSRRPRTPPSHRLHHRQAQTAAGPSPLEPIWARPSPSGAEASSRNKPTPKSLRSSLAIGTAPPPASPGRAGPWSPYEHRRQGGEGLDLPSQTQGMESHRRWRRPGFARRPLSAAATGQGLFSLTLESIFFLLICSRSFLLTTFCIRSGIKSTNVFPSFSSLRPPKP
jgi:hypothetical protein